MAARYGINVIPEIDVPAHSLAFTQYNPRLAADNKEYGMDHLDLYKQEVYDFVDTLFDEYLSGENPVFVGPRCISVQMSITGKNQNNSVTLQIIILILYRNTVRLRVCGEA